jgi:hypothetical protein
MYRKTRHTLQLHAKRNLCAAMRAAKECKRMADAAPLRDVGGLLTDGCMGAHTVRLLAWPDESRHLAVVVDGKHRQVRTLRGVVRIVAEMIYKRSAI